MPHQPPPNLEELRRGVTSDADRDLLERIDAFLEPDPFETTLEVVAEALAAAYRPTTFATAGALIAELEERGLHLARVRHTGSTHFVKANEEIKSR